MHSEKKQKQQREEDGDGDVQVQVDVEENLLRNRSEEAVKKCREAIRRRLRLKAERAALKKEEEEKAENLKKMKIQQVFPLFLLLFILFPYKEDLSINVRCWFTHN